MEVESTSMNIWIVPITVGDYVLKSKLGEGSFSIVWKAEHRFSGQLVAVKQVYLSKLNRHLKNCLNCGLTFLSSVNHPNIIRLFDVFQVMMDDGVYGGLSIVALRNKKANSPHPPEKSCIFLVLEFCAGGNLASYINQHGRVDEEIVTRIMQQLGAGLEILRSHHIIHRDLKPENILLSGSEDDMLLKIADFGLSRSVLPGDYAETVCGSPLYMAPEVLEFQRYDEKVDMWSVGTILFELLNGFPPFRGRTNVQVLKNIKSSTCLPFSQHILPGLNPDCLDMCLKLLSLNPGNRLSFNEFWRHKFLR